MTLLRPGLLSARTVALAGDPGSRIRAELTSLGASLTELPARDLDDDRAEERIRSGSPVDALLAASGELELSAGQRLESALDATWTAVRAVAVGALIPQGNGGKIVLLGPRPDAGDHAPAIRAAAENLARTLSVEWARYAITVTAIAPGRFTDQAQLATVVGFLLSPAGDYFSGCRLELGAVGA